MNVSSLSCFVFFIAKANRREMDYGFESLNEKNKAPTTRVGALFCERAV
jgi:hypothetical protein